MPIATQGNDVTGEDQGAKRFWVSAFLLASAVAEPFTFQALAKDKPAAKSKAPTKIARTVDEGTRAGAIVDGDKHPLLGALQHARSSRDSVAKATDYSAIFMKREKIKDQLISQTMEMKFRQEPFSVYLKYVEPHAGREVIFVDGKNKGNFLVHEDGIKALAGTLSFSPTGTEAMSENRYPVTKIGIANMLDIVISQWEEEMKFGEIDVKYYPNAKIGDQECKLIVSTHPQSRPNLKFHKTSLYIEKATNLPIRVEQHGFPVKGDEAPLIEEYNYTNLKLNVGLKNTDFDTKNKEYNF